MMDTWIEGLVGDATVTTQPRSIATSRPSRSTKKSRVSAGRSDLMFGTALLTSRSGSIARPADHAPRTPRHYRSGQGSTRKVARMRKVIYSQTVSLDGFIADRDGEIDWSAPDEELHRFHNERTRELGAHFCGRRLYETMVYWETADENPSAPESALEFARIWQALPKSSSRRRSRRSRATQAGHGGRGRGGREAQGAAGQGHRRRWRRPGLQLDRAGPRRRVPPLRQPGRARRGDAVLPGGGARIGLELVETRTFGLPVVYLRYRRA